MRSSNAGLVMPFLIVCIVLTVVRLIMAVRTIRQKQRERPQDHGIHHANRGNIEDIASEENPALHESIEPLTLNSSSKTILKPLHENLFPPMRSPRLNLQELHGMPNLQKELPAWSPQ